MDNKPLWKWLLLLVGGSVLFLVSYGITSVPASLYEELKYPMWLLVLLCVAGAVLNLLLYAGWWKWTEKRKAEDLPKLRLATDTGLGFGIGILYFVLGGYRVTGIGNDWAALFQALCIFLVVAVGEEILFRGIVFRMIDQRWGTWVALAVSALIFGFVHITNDNATVWSSVAIAVEAGLLLGAAYKWSGTLWLPIGIHWAWNFFQGPVFGFAVSGNETQSLLKAVIDGPAWLTGGTFGAEASVPAFVVGLIVAIVFLVVPRRG